MWTEKDIDQLTRQDILNICGGGDIFKFRDIFQAIFGEECDQFFTYSYWEAGISESELKKGDLVQSSYIIYFSNEYEKTCHPERQYPYFSVHKWDLLAAKNGSAKNLLDDIYHYGRKQDLKQFIDDSPEIFYSMIKTRPQMFETIYNNLDIINNNFKTMNTKRFVFDKRTKTATVEDFNVSFNSISNEIDIPSCIDKSTVDDLEFIYTLGRETDDMNRNFLLDYGEDFLDRYNYLLDDD